MWMRCHLFRLLRLQNLLLLTAAMVLLYLVKLLANNQAQIQAQIDNAPVAFNRNQVQDSLQGFPGYLESSDLNIAPFQVKNRRKIDWHNFTQIEYEKKRVGIGEQGLPARLLSEEAEREKQLYAVNGFNGALSDAIPLNRSLPDIRHAGCRSRRYLAALPTVSVVVPFHNEHWSTLLRTAHSVLHRSPHELIKEVFLVDDASTKDFLGSKLEAYLSEHMPKVKVVRLKERSGLIAARLAGARLARGDVLVFLDSHTEANVNWLPPLLEPIALEWRTVTCPYIDVVSFDTFEYRAQDGGARGAFDWEFFYKRLPLLPSDELNMPDPFPSPVMAGGLFAISRAFFWHLGGYDPGLDIWGGEQYELSFKIWQCGGRMLDVPCSRVGHIYRKFAPFPNPGHGDFVGKNYRRVAEVWMDEYAEYLYSRRPYYRDVDPGDLTAQRALRRKLHCKSFRWFITQIAFDLTAKYPPVEPKPFAEGKVTPASEAAATWCVDAHHGAQMDKLTLRECAAATEREFLFSWHKDVRSRTRNMCWDLPESAAGSPVRLFSCHLGGGNQLWRYLPETKQIRHGTSDVCVEYSLTPPAVFVSQCSSTESQRWAVDTVHADMMERWPHIKERVVAPQEHVDE